MEYAQIKNAQPTNGSIYSVAKLLIAHLQHSSKMEDAHMEMMMMEIATLVTLGMDKNAH
jgi:hypothetical protein